MDKIKTLANCEDIEFLRQTNKIRKSVQKWLKATDIAAIRKNVPDLLVIPKGANEDEVKDITEHNKKLMQEQGMKNLDKMLDAMLEDHPEETLEVLKLCCFVDPSEKTSLHITYYMTAFTEMLQEPAVTDFFRSLLTLVKSLGSEV